MGAPLNKKNSGPGEMLIRLTIREDAHPEAFKVMEATPNRGRTKRIIELISTSYHAGLHASVLSALVKNMEEEFESKRALRESMEKMTAFTGDFQKTIGQVHSDQQAHAREMISALQHFQIGSVVPSGTALVMSSESGLSPDNKFDVNDFPSGIADLNDFGKTNGSH